MWPSTMPSARRRCLGQEDVCVVALAADDEANDITR